MKELKVSMIINEYEILEEVKDNENDINNKFEASEQASLKKMGVFSDESYNLK